MRKMSNFRADQIFAVAFAIAITALVFFLSSVVGGALFAKAADINAPAIIPPYDPHLDAVHAPRGVFGTGKVWHVGPSQENKSFAAIARQLHDGDVVEIEAATYGCSEQSIVWYANNVTVVGVGGRPVFDLKGCGISGGKGIFNPRGINMIIDNIEFTGAAVGSRNGAGIRLDGGGYVYITNAYFHDNQDGVLLTPDSHIVKATPTDIVIDHSEFSHNGAGDGQSHNMYISTNNVHSFTLRFSYSHDAHVGHEVKSRANRNYILYNRIADEQNGDASYQIDLPQGGLSYIVGNIVQEGARAENRAIVSYSAERTHNPIQAVYIANNTFVANTSASGTAVNLYDHGLTDAVMVNNLITGNIPENRIVGVAPAKMTLRNNIRTDSPGFFDAANRNYALTASSPAVDAGIDPGSARGFDLTPVYQYVFPLSGKRRPSVGKLDVGALEHDPSEKITPAPTISFSAVKTTLDYHTPALLSWSSTNAKTCRASGAWGGSRGPSGSYSSAPLDKNAAFSISCTGAGGSATAKLDIAVNDSVAAAALGDYTWRALPHTAIRKICAGYQPAYADNRGTGPYCGSYTPVYVPDTHRWYFMGFSGRNYYGNEVYALDLDTLKLEMVTTPTLISQTQEYVPSDIYGSKVHYRSCSTTLHLKSGGIAIGPRSMTGTVAWDPLIKKIVAGPGGRASRALRGCSSGSQRGDNATDQWAFDPFTKTWSRLASDDPHFSSVSLPTWFLDPATGIAYFSSGRNEPLSGGYLIDYYKTPPKYALVDNIWPFQLSTGPVAVDTTHHYALQLGKNDIVVFDLNGLSLSKYGANGGRGTNGNAGGPGPIYKGLNTNRTGYYAGYTAPGTWTVTGNTEALSHPTAGLTYNPKLDRFVAYPGGSTIYFLKPNYRTRTLNILAKTVPGGPTGSVGYSGFVYMPERDDYLAFAGTGSDLFQLVPPADGTGRPFSRPAPDRP